MATVEVTVTVKVDTGGDLHEYQHEDLVDSIARHIASVGTIHRGVTMAGDLLIIGAQVGTYVHVCE